MFYRFYKLRPRVRVGLRTLKTALAVGLSLFVVSLFGELSIFPALAAIAVMSPTFEDAIGVCRAQMVGILVGGVLGCITVKLWPSPAIWFMGLGIVLIFTFCAARRLEYAGTLSCCIFLSACLSGSDTVIVNTLTRLLHTAVGLTVGLGINILVLPYDNRGQILKLLRQACGDLPEELRQCVLLRHYPDLSDREALLSRLHYELRIYGHQLLPKGRDRSGEIAFLTGCVQLAERMLQELFAISCMDAIGAPSAENRARLAALGLPDPGDAPDAGAQAEDTTVFNYHLGKLLDARDYLSAMLDAAQETQTEAPPPLARAAEDLLRKVKRKFDKTGRF